MIGRPQERTGKHRPEHGRAGSPQAIHRDDPQHDQHGRHRPGRGRGGHDDQSLRPGDAGPGRTPTSPAATTGIFSGTTATGNSSRPSTRRSSPGIALTSREIPLVLDGQQTTIALTLTPLKQPDQDFSGMIVVLDDLTQLIKAQKIAAWKEVAQRVAHEIKNPLTPIQLNAERIIKNLRKTDGGGREIIEQGAKVIIQEAQTIKSLVDEFSDFARLPKTHLQAANLHDIIGQVVTMFRGIFADVQFELTLAPDVPAPLQLDAEQMKRVFINLIDNAIDAMNKKGKIVIQTFFDKDGHQVRIEVTDNGPGIPLEDKEKLFLPHFSTKKKGTGLGLAIVSQIIKEHNGAVHVQNNKPSGAKFMLQIAGMIQERILVIDDESSIRSSLQGILEDEGYEVQTAGNGRGRSGPPSNSELRAGSSRYLAARNERHRRPPPDPDPGGTSPGRRHLGTWHGRNGGQSDEARRVRLPRETAVARKGRPDRQERAAAAQARGGEYPAPRAPPAPAIISSERAPRSRSSGPRSRRPPRRTAASSSRGETERARNSSPASSTSRAGGRTSGLSRSTARRYPTTSSKASSSALSAGIRRTRSRTKRANFSSPTAGRSSWTRSAR